MKKFGALALLMMGTTAIASPALAFGEAGPLTLSQFGGFFVGVDYETAEDGNIDVIGQSWVGFGLPEDQTVTMPVILIHGGGGQAADWLTTVDGRDGWASYMMANGVATYWIDRPGLGRSPADPSYEEGSVGQPPYSLIAGLASSEHWPDANPVEGEWSREAWVEANPENQGVINWLAGSPGGPYGGNAYAARNIIELAEKVGPAILFGHSAGVASTLAAAIGAPEGTVGGVLIYEGGVDLLSEDNIAAANWEPALADDFTPVDVDGCQMQPEDAVSTNVSLADIPIVIIRSEHGNQSDEQFGCAVRQLEQMGVDAKFIQMADIGFQGGGHFMMSDTNSGELATQVLLPIIAHLSDGAELPADWTILEQ